MRTLLAALALVLVAVPTSCSKVPSAHAECLSAADSCRPDIVGTTLDGKPFTEESLRGKVVLVNFWATWCGPCVHEIPALDAVYKRHANDFVVIGILAADATTDDDAVSFLKQRGASYPVLRSTPELERRFGLRSALPATFLYDQKGKLQGHWEGGLSERLLEWQVGKLINPPSGG